MSDSDDGRKNLYQRVADSADALLRAYGGGGFGLIGVVRRPYDLAAATIVGLILLMAIYAGGERRNYLAWLWAGVAAASVLLAVYERNRADRLGAEGAEGFRDPARVEATAAAAQDIYEHAQRNITGESPDDEQSLHPHLYAVSKLRGNQRWLRGDPHLVAALNTLRPFSLHDGHRVRLILEFLGEFYKRYDRLLNRPNHVHVRNEYTILYDVHVKTLNLIHELYFTKNLVLCANLEVVTRTVQARTERMLRVLRHKYPAELRALHVVLGSAPRAYDGSWTSYDLYV